jgi:hypothetical protein
MVSALESKTTEPAGGESSATHLKRKMSPWTGFKLVN